MKQEVEGGRGQRKRVTWPPASCMECGPAAGLLPVRRWEGEREVVCSGARGRGLDDAKPRASVTRKREAEA